METIGLIFLIVVALGFDYTNGFHDAANAIATSVSTRALTPRKALALAAVFNLIGSLVSTKVASTVGKGIIDVPNNHEGLVIVFAAVIGAIVWNLITWYFGLPSSSSHALIGGLVGAALASSGQVHWSGIVDKVIIPMVLSPLVGFVLAFIVMVALLWLFRRSNPRRVNRGFKYGQWVSSAAMAYGHGLQDAQKSMGVITLALVVTHHLDEFVVPLWVKFACAIAIAAGTYSGGWRIMRTLGRRVFKLDSSGGFAAQSVASSVLMTTAYAYAAPISTTHVITSSVMGVGATRKLSAVRWGVAGNILTAWVLTLPMAGLVAAGVFAIAHLIVN
ncbi:MAG TPA: inorganic phosphate transporter [Mycobacteriales bacterium]|nr:inorganic phosphate transporter [Mycobacteriales bacterium]